MKKSNTGISYGPVFMLYLNGCIPIFFAYGLPMMYPYCTLKKLLCLELHSKLWT